MEQSETANPKVSVFATSQGIVVEGTQSGEWVTLYNIQGTQLQSIQSKGERLVLQAVGNLLILIPYGKNEKIGDLNHHNLFSVRSSISIE